MPIFRGAFIGYEAFIREWASERSFTVMAKRHVWQKKKIVTILKIITE